MGNTNTTNTFSFTTSCPVAIQETQVCYQTVQAAVTSSSNQNALVDRLIILENGNIGIGTTNPGTKLQVGEQSDGSAARANAWATWSDLRLKKDLQVIPDALKKINEISGYYFYWQQGNAGRQVGLIAQEIEKILPEMVYTDDKGYKSLDNSKITALLIQGMKEQQKIIDLLQKKIDKLEKD